MVFITKSFNPKWFLIMSSVNSMSSGKESMVTVKSVNSFGFHTWLGRVGGCR